MKLIIISGRSGSGKSTALHQLEDEGYYSIDNLPVSLLPSLVTELSSSDLREHRHLAVCIDARNTPQDLARFEQLSQQVKSLADTTVVYLDADSQTLIKRFSETRRRHPLSNKEVALLEAIDQERHLLEPILLQADLTIDTSSMTVHDLRDVVRARLAGHSHSLSLQLLSFGFKRGIPIDADIVFDLRMLPNPHWVDTLRPLTGRDQAVRDFLDGNEDVEAMYSDIHGYLSRWLPKITRSNRSYVTVALGCTGGQHRSVYLAERLAQAMADDHDNLQLRHRELSY